MTNSTHNNSHHIPFDELIAYLDGLVAAFEEHPDEATREAVFSLLQGIDGLHREAFKRLALFLEDHQAGHLLVEAASVDRLLNTVLSLYDVLPDEVAVAQVEAALARVRPYIEAHGGSLNVLTIEGGVVHLEMGGACHGCAGSAMTLQRGVRQALQQGFPGFIDIVVHEPATARGQSDQQGVIALEQIYVAPPLLQAPIFETVAQQDDVPPGGMKQVTLDDLRLLLASVAGEIYVVGDMCPGSMLPLSTGRLDGAIVTCPWHREQYDVRSGRCIETAGRRDQPRLPVYPVAVRENEIQVAVNVSARPLIMEAPG
jgi:nitrite reductase/ring-hydroxylating ferredoxin subunit/Fe-S cluster biogenesis protein NfuA